MDLGLECPICLAPGVMDEGGGPCLDEAHHTSFCQSNQPPIVEKGATSGIRWASAPSKSFGAGTRRGCFGIWCVGYVGTSNGIILMWSALCLEA